MPQDFGLSIVCRLFSVCFYEFGILSVASLVGPDIPQLAGANEKVCLTINEKMRL